MVVEMEQMASRPFSACPVFLERPVDVLNTKKEPPDLRGSNRRKKVSIWLIFFVYLLYFKIEAHFSSDEDFKRLDCHDFNSVLSS